MKFIFVTGGVVSSLGKGLTAASLGTLLENRGLKVALQKFDPYLNVDPGTMNPYQHGEVYALVVAEVKIGFCAVVEHIHLAVLIRVHGAGVHVQVGEVY